MPETDGTRKNRKLRWALAAVVLALAALLLPPLVNINRYKQRITEEIGASLGRPIHFSTVKLRLLPRPGFAIENFQVDEDPNFGWEPCLRAQTVLASVSPASLWHGHLEISRISLDEASVNLTRNEHGLWNLSNMLSRPGSQGLGAGPALPHESSRPHNLPYVELTNTRINLKIGVDKLPFSLTDADASLWLNRPGQWRFRVRGQPVRTDVPLVAADTGDLRIDGSVGDGTLVAANMAHLPFSLHVDWQGGQLGQLTRILLGRDAGWRGDLHAVADLKGSATQILVHTRVRADEVRREGLAQTAPLDFDAVCDATYERPDHMLTSTVCDSPIGKGHVRLEGSYPLQPGAGAPDLSLKVMQVPAQAPLDLLRTVRSDFAPGVTAEGVLNGELHYTETADNTDNPVNGAIAADGIRLTGGGLKAPLALPSLSFHSLEPGAPIRAHGKVILPVVPQRKALVLDPVELDLGGATPLRFGATVDSHGYLLSVEGDAAIDSLVNISHALHLAPNGLDLPVAGGSGEMGLNASGPWIAAAEVSDSVTGWVHLRKTRLTEPFLAASFDVDDLDLLLSHESMSWSWNTIRFGAIAPVAPRGSVKVPLQCSGDCRPQFALSFDHIDISSLERTLLGATRQETLLSELLDRFQKTPPSPEWPRLQGTVKIASLALGNFTATNVTAEASLADHALHLGHLAGETLGGSVKDGSLSMEAASGQPEFTLSLNLNRAHGDALVKLLAPEGDLPFAPEGTVDLSLRLDGTGYATDQLTGSATGRVDWSWSKGRYRLDGKNLTRFDLWKGSGEISGKQLRVHSTVAGKPVEGSLTLWPKTTANLHPVK